MTNHEMTRPDSERLRPFHAYAISEPTVVVCEHHIRRNRPRYEIDLGMKVYNFSVYWLAHHR